MNLDQAVQQLDAIWSQVAKGESFRGYRARSVAGTGLLGLLAAALQSWLIRKPAESIDAYLWLWVAVATVSAGGVAIELLVRYWHEPSHLERANTRHAMEQFAPCLLVGAALTWVLGEVAVESLWMLPGLWALLFSLGVFASARMIAPAVIWVAVWYAAAGIACLLFARGDYAFSPWAMAGAFGGGQLLMAAVLYVQVERPHAS